MSQTLDDCVKYFKGTGGFDRLMEGLFDLFVRYERCYGAVRLSKPTPEEERAVSDFFSRDYYNQALIRIGLADFERRAQKVFSPSVTLEALLEAYFNRKLTRQEGPRYNGGAFALYLENEIIPRHGGTDAAEWLKEVSAHMRRTYRKLAEGYQAEPAEVNDTLEVLCAALNDTAARGAAGSPDRAPAAPLREFSRKHTGDERGLGKDGKYGPYFLRALAWKYDAAFPSSPEDYAGLYFRAGLMADGVTSRVAVRGLTASRDGKTPDEVCALYNRRGEPHLLTLENLNGFTRAAAHGNRVFVVENIAVFSALCERVRGGKFTLLCNENGLGPAAALLLDMLYASGAEIYYSGDMDYSGLRLADRVYLRNPRRFIPWRLTKADYERVISDTEFFAGNRQKETGLHCEDLAALLSFIRKKGKTAAQAALVEDLAADIRQMTALS